MLPVYAGWTGLGGLVHKPYVYAYPVTTAGCNITDISQLANISEPIYDPATWNPQAHYRSVQCSNSVLRGRGFWNTLSRSSFFWIEIFDGKLQHPPHVIRALPLCPINYIQRRGVRALVFFDHNVIFSSTPSNCRNLSVNVLAKVWYKCPTNWQFRGWAYVWLFDLPLWHCLPAHTIQLLYLYFFHLCNVYVYTLHLFLSKFKL